MGWSAPLHPLRKVFGPQGVSNTPWHEPAAPLATANGLAHDAGGVSALPREVPIESD